MKKKYSHFIRPLKIIIDILIINIVIYYINDKEYLNFKFLSYIIVFWLIISYFTGFYKVYRYTKTLRIFRLLIKQFTFFTLSFFAFFGVFKEGIIVNNQFDILALTILFVTTSKFLGFFILKKYRSIGKNYRTTIVVGFDDTAERIVKIFNSKANLGYKYLGFFSNKAYNSKEYLGKVDTVFNYVDNNDIDEIYCTLSVLSKDEVKTFNKFTLEKGIAFKLIPNINELYSKKQSIEFYDDTLPILNVSKLPFEFAENFYVKRLFDILFSLIIIVFILSWLTPILWVLIKIESKGPLIFRQKREGLNSKEFMCYKFRSMKLNDLSNVASAVKNDSRVTKIGAFIRKTSIDELPQFFNVLLGDMSIVGPRPHIEILSIKYQKEIDDYLKRNIVKPGITGLAQVTGYRGEVKKKADMKNRVRLDIFYIENWSFFLDIKIILKTISNIYKGEEKAY